MSMVWKSASNPPSGSPGKWSEEVVVFTNLSNIYQLCYMVGVDGPGHWQNPAAFQRNEKVDWWIEKPPAQGPDIPDR